MYLLILVKHDYRDNRDPDIRRKSIEIPKPQVILRIASINAGRQSEMLFSRIISIVGDIRKARFYETWDGQGMLV